jgi:hypothetical protein
MLNLKMMTMTFQQEDLQVVANLLEAQVADLAGQVVVVQVALREAADLQEEADLQVVAVQVALQEEEDLRVVVDLVALQEEAAHLEVVADLPKRVDLPKKADLLVVQSDVEEDLHGD